MFTYYMKKIPSRCLYNIKIYKHGHEFGILNFQIQIQTKHAVLNNLEMNEKYCGYGSFFLKKFESYVSNIYDVKNIRLLAWQPSGDDKVVSFFKKHGYEEYSDVSKRQTYDDSIVIFDLHKMRKNI